MIHPSYTDLMNVVNANVEPGEEPVVNSRYSIVLATAKRAKQIINGAPPEVRVKCDKPLSIAVDELNAGAVRILTGNEPDNIEDYTEGSLDDYEDLGLVDFSEEDAAGADDAADGDAEDSDDSMDTIDFGDDISADAENILTE